MGSGPTKAAANVYCKCRMEAAKYNDKLSSREGAAEALGVSPSTLAGYELGLTKVVPVDKVVCMADLYHAPELTNWYCAHECPIGVRSVPELQVTTLDRVALKILHSLQEVSAIKETVIAITADGMITKEEQPQLAKVIAALDAIAVTALELRMWAEKRKG